MLDYIGFNFKDFDSAWVVIVDELPKSYSEDNLLQQYYPFGYIRVVGKPLVETWGVSNFLYIITTSFPYVATFHFAIVRFCSPFRFSGVQVFTGR